MNYLFECEDKEIAFNYDFHSWQMESGYSAKAFGLIKNPAALVVEADNIISCWHAEFFFF